MTDERAAAADPLADWNEFVVHALTCPHGPPPVETPLGDDLLILTALLPFGEFVTRMQATFRRLGFPTEVRLLIPSAGFAHPERVGVVQILGVDIRMDPELAWPAISIDLPRPDPEDYQP